MLSSNLGSSASCILGVNVFSSLRQRRKDIYSCVDKALVKIAVDSRLKGVLVGRQGAMASKFFEIVGFSEISIFRWKLFGILLLVMITVWNYIGKSLTLAPYHSTT